MHTAVTARLHIQAEIWASGIAISKYIQHKVLHNHVLLLFLCTGAALYVYVNLKLESC